MAGATGNLPQGDGFMVSTLILTRSRLPVDGQLGSRSRVMSLPMDETIQKVSYEGTDAILDLYFADGGNVDSTFLRRQD